jgi:hypothetical protein
MDLPTLLQDKALLSTLSREYELLKATDGEPSGLDRSRSRHERGWRHAHAAAAAPLWLARAAVLLSAKPPTHCATCCPARAACINWEQWITECLQRAAATRASKAPAAAHASDVGTSAPPPGFTAAAQLLSTGKASSSQQLQRPAAAATWQVG